MIRDLVSQDSIGDHLRPCSLDFAHERIYETSSPGDFHDGGIVARSSVRYLLIHPLRPIFRIRPSDMSNPSCHSVQSFCPICLSYSPAQVLKQLLGLRGPKDPMKTNKTDWSLSQDVRK